MMKIFTVITALTAAFFSKAAFANPACAVCTVAVGATLGISRKLGIDDTVIGVWLGAFLMLMVVWTIVFCKKKNWRFHGMFWVILAVTFSLVIPIYTFGYITYEARTIFGIDAFLISVIAGAVIIPVSDKLYLFMKKKNGGHAHFPFEKVFVPVAMLALVSFAFYYGSEYVTVNTGTMMPSLDDLM